jgi:diguanylate cyclase (GGDEF)-like protein
MTISLDSVLAVEALKRRHAFFIADLTDEAKASPEIAALRALNMEIVVPLIQEVETPEMILEGCLFLGARLAKRPYIDSDINFLDVLGKMLAICLRNEALYRRSIVDDLTGVASRGHFEAHLAQQISRIQIYGHRSLGLVLLDVDHFKKFNDTYGHQTGDRVLQELARTLMAQVRNVDLVCRYGGEEFAVILLEIDRPRVLEVAERLRKAIAAMDVVAMDGTKLKVTASLGAACFPNDVKTKTELIQKADQALYRAKDGGRNQVVMTEETPQSLEILAAKTAQPDKPSDSHALRRRAGEGEEGAAE